ncbi:envelope glycoprotein [Labeo rohita]|uniref:Envelope glycoprotein n=1 Tax=Labeo rohita TaxID=84645 RepID=A0ABQ8L3N3_LABRO|nr:envelope glycoprotein [Labeo rohita]
MAKQKLTQTQQEFSRPALKLTKTRTDITPLHLQEYEATEEDLCMLSPFHQAKTV